VIGTKYFHINLQLIFLLCINHNKTRQVLLKNLIDGSFPINYHDGEVAYLRECSKWSKCIYFNKWIQLVNPIKCSLWLMPTLTYIAENYSIV
jgi:hypothetical protein